MKEYKEIFKIENPLNEKILVGPNDSYLKAIESKFNVSLKVYESKISSDGEKNINDTIECIFYVLDTLTNINININLGDFFSILNNVTVENCESILSIFSNKEIIYTTVSNKSIYPRTLNQKLYLNYLNNNDIVFAIGPAGTGKTFLAVMYALKLLKSNNYRKLILVRPVVEAGEKLGFLPGDLKEKIDPYLVPIYDSLYDGLSKEATNKLIEKGVIEVAPLAYMRGRTLENAIIILDEAQNTTKSQMKMFLTRLGFNSKMIITGDITQIDLLNKNESGLIESTKILDGLKGLKIITFNKGDVSRHPLIYDIIKRYEDDN